MSELFLDGYSGDSMLTCDDTTCRFGGKCVLDGDELYKCVCHFNCAAVRYVVANMLNNIQQHLLLLLLLLYYYCY